MDQGGDTYQEGARQVDEQRRGVLSTLFLFLYEFHYQMSFQFGVKGRGSDR